jgi:prepilin signal peptidase PulO-like enzyme (type II secretory pathway)
MNALSSPAVLGAVFATVAGVATVIARVLPVAVDRLAGPPFASPRLRRLFGALFVAGAIALAWWELVAQGQVPVVAGGVVEPAAATVLLSRYAAHLVLFSLLTVATWVDFRQRVIPDAITVPGVLVGLVWVAIHPDSLLPVAIEVPRSFAAPRLEPDVLGAWGGLHAVGVPAVLGGRPALGGLVAALILFFAWWIVGTAPACDAEGRPLPAPRGWRRLGEPRLGAATIGLLTIGTGWLVGGSQWAGIWASLLGILVSGAIVWLTRIGASRALGQEALGFGDVTLMAMAGSWLGWQACLLACCLAVFLGLGHGLLQYLRQRENELPFGPSLCLALGLVVVTWRPLWERASPFFERPGELAIVITAVIVLTAVSLAIWRRVRDGYGGERA